MPVVHPCFGLGNGAQFSAVHIGYGILEMLLAALPLVHLHQAIVPFGRSHHNGGFANAVGQRLLHIHVFAGCTGIHRHQAMPVVRRGNDHHVHFLHGQHLPVIGKQRGLDVYLLQIGRTLSQHRVIHIAQSHTLYGRDLEHGAEVGPAHALAANEAHTHCIVGRYPLPVSGQQFHGSAGQ